MIYGPKGPYITLLAINRGDNMKKIRLSLFLIAVTVASTTVSNLALSEDTPVVQSEKGQVVFYRPSRAKGAAIRFQIEGSAKGSIGALSNGEVIRKDLEPGSHTFTVRSPSVDGRDSITLNVVAGEVYYVKGEILWGWPAGRPKFSRMSDSEAQADLGKMK